MKKSVLLASVVAMSFLGGCASLDSRLAQEFAKIRRGPSGSPYKSITNFSDALTCVDDLMLVKGVKDIPVMVEDIDDKTEEVKTGTRDMLISAISRMTTKSKAIKLIAYGKDSGNLVSFMKAANYVGAYKEMPLFDIQGSITQFDKGVVSTDSSVGLFQRKKGGGGAAHGSSLNVVALDLNVLQASDMSVMPGITSSNSVAIFQRADSLDMDASINKLGIYFDLSLNASEGKAQAVRNLVDLAAVELVGKLVGVPYGKCLGVKEPAVGMAGATGQTGEKGGDSLKPTVSQPVDPAKVVAVKLPKLTPKQDALASSPTVRRVLNEGDSLDPQGIVRVKRIVTTSQP
ncbi:hypothetical protein [Thiothrix nivea]|uniref:Curli production assembly/transport component CsgG n=1 Tax=Thiothrix nivea (strain ATCC 35100 / DSM 5205 / JP2) TaxID=870187 RepID=A0A656HJS3_THINJ|nr:hypothetical protein [Thiothrix nivea]EIJ35509.1 hypothetical protein Thini_2983 [Thiothrix nivea DSM 5205]